ncbi:hypothetical protein NC651_016844 [Populus alba x Populus x berolinensis]|nr:hypothetical protein NC651_016844 [Populus alba x Populus x berolinensis]
MHCTYLSTLVVKMSCHGILLLLAMLDMGWQCKGMGFLKR